MHAAACSYGVVLATRLIRQVFAASRRPAVRALADVAGVEDLYAKMARAPSPVDLDGLWKRLGVTASGVGVAFDEQAELTSIRRAIMAAPARDQGAGKSAGSQ